MFKLAIETVNDEPSLLDGAKVQDRDNAIRAFDHARQAEQRRNALAQSLYTSISLLTDDPAEAPSGWESADPEFPWIVDGELFPAFEDCPRGCGVRVRTDAGWKRHFDFDCPVRTLESPMTDIPEDWPSVILAWKCDHCGMNFELLSEINCHLNSQHPEWNDA